MYISYELLYDFHYVDAAVVVVVDGGGPAEIIQKYIIVMI